MAENTADSTLARPHLPGFPELFRAFAQMALSGFGGVLPWARRVIVDDRRWMTPAEFNDAMALCQFLPGPNVVNFSIVFGSRLRGVKGAIVSFAGLLGPPVAIVLVLGILYREFGEVDGLRRVLAGVAPAAAGLIVATAAKMAMPLARGRFRAAPAIAAAVLVGVGLLGWPLHMVLLGLAPLSIVLAWVRRS